MLYSVEDKLYLADKYLKEKNMSNVQLVNLGSYPNDGSGDDLRTAFIKSNTSLTQLDLVKVEFAENVGLGAPVFLDKQATTLRFRSLESPTIPDIKEKIAISYDSDSITLSVIAIADLIEDTSPQLGGSLDLNNFDVNGIGNILLNGNISGNTITANTVFLGNLTGDVTSSGLSTFANIDINSGTIDDTIIGSTTANLITGTTITATTGFIGDLYGNVFGINSDITIESYNTLTNTFNNIFLNGLTITGNHITDPGLTAISTVVGDGLTIFGDTQLTLFSNNPITIDQELIVNGIITTDQFIHTTGISQPEPTNSLTIYSANTINIDSLWDIKLEVGPQFDGDGGSITLLAGGGGETNFPGSTVGGGGGAVYISGGVGGNNDTFGAGGDIFITGGIGETPGNVIIKGGEKVGPGNRGIVTVDNIRFSTNGSLTNPSVGQALVWNGSNWVPQNVSPTNPGVTRIIAGSNITISPTNGVGEVTVNAASGGSFIGLNTFDFGNFKNIFTSPITYLLNQVGLDFGTFTSPTQVTVELGSF